MKHVLAVFCGFLLLAVSITFVGAATTEEITALVKQTTEAIEKNALQTFARTSRAEHPYKNAENPSLYVFIFNYQHIPD